MARFWRGRQSKGNMPAHGGGTGRRRRRSKRWRRQPATDLAYSCPKCKSSKVTVFSTDADRRMRVRCGCGADGALAVVTKGGMRFLTRNNLLREMGFESYKAYLASDLWATIRSRVFERDGHKCKGCGKPARSVHHITYGQAVLQGLDDSQLVSICGGCHKFIEFDGEHKLTATTAISRRLARRAIKKIGGANSKALREALKPKCRLCQKQFKRLGRDDICMRCYKSGRARLFRQTVQVAIPTVAEAETGLVRKKQIPGGWLTATQAPGCEAIAGSRERLEAASQEESVSDICATIDRQE